MESELKYIDIVEQPISMHPKKFALWLFLVTVLMIFAALTSAYIVRQAEGNWLEYELPEIFWVTSGIVILSSIAMQVAYFAAKKDNFLGLRIGMVATVLLGIGFLVGQWYSWVALVDREVFFVGNPAGSFLYVFTGLHAVHLISGVIFLIIVLI
jgi:cytochrome c oxidase subunit 3